MPWGAYHPSSNLPRMWLAPRLQWKPPWLHYNRCSWVSFTDDMGTPEVKQLGIREAERFEHSPNRGLNNFSRWRAGSFSGPTLPGAEQSGGGDRSFGRDPALSGFCDAKSTELCNRCVRCCSIARMGRWADAGKLEKMWGQHFSEIGPQIRTIRFAYIPDFMKSRV